jgi:hypothetical protein
VLEVATETHLVVCSYLSSLYHDLTCGIIIITSNCQGVRPFLSSSSLICLVSSRVVLGLFIMLSLSYLYFAEFLSAFAQRGESISFSSLKAWWVQIRSAYNSHICVNCKVRLMHLILAIWLVTWSVLMLKSLILFFRRFELNSHKVKGIGTDIWMPVRSIYVPLCKIWSHVSCNEAFFLILRRRTNVIVKTHIISSFIQDWYPRCYEAVDHHFHIRIGCDAEDFPFAPMKDFSEISLKPSVLQTDPRRHLRKRAYYMNKSYLSSLCLTHMKTLRTEKLISGLGAVIQHVGL